MEMAGGGHGQNNTESIQTTFTSATDDAGNTVRLNTPVLISLSKSQVLWNYPLTYLLVPSNPLCGVGARGSGEGASAGV